MIDLKAMIFRHLHGKCNKGNIIVHGELYDFFDLQKQSSNNKFTLIGRKWI